MLVTGALSLIDIIKRLADARKIKGGKLDDRKLEEVKGKVTLGAGTLNIQATYKLDGVKHEVVAQRTVVGEKASIKIDGKAMDKPDIDLHSGTSGLKLVVKYVLQYEEAGKFHELRLYAFVSLLNL